MKNILKLSLVSSMLFLGFASRAMCDNKDSSLIGYWSFDEANGNLLKDLSGCGHDGEIKGSPKWVDGIKGGALEFDGIENCVKIPSLNLPQIFTITFFIKPESVEGGAEGKNVIGKTGSDYTNFYVFINRDANKISFMVPGIAGASNVITPSRWHHVTMSYDLKELLVYIDGISVVRKRKEGIVENNDEPLMLGGSVKGRMFKGTIDELEIYNKVLGEDEIRQRVSLIKEPEEKTAERQGLIAYFPINEGQGTVAYDKSGHANHGSIRDGIWIKEGSNNGLEFDGKKTYVSVPHQDCQEFKDQFTLSVWIRPTTILGSSAFLSKSRGHVGGYGLGMRDGIVCLRLYIGEGIKSGLWTIESPFPLEPKKWYFITATFDGTKEKKAALYLNGQKIAEKEVTGKISYFSPYDKDIPLPLTISGACPFPVIHDQFSGFIREVKMFSYALSPEEIKDEYQKNFSLSQIQLETTHEKFLRTCTAKLTCKIRDEKTGQPLNVKCLISDARGIYYFPENSLAYGDSGNGHFYGFGEFEIALPPGNFKAVFLRGFEYEPLELEITLEDKENKKIEVKLKRLFNLTEKGWYGGDEELQLEGHGYTPYNVLLTGANIINSYKIFSAEGLNWFHIVRGMEEPCFKLDNESIAGWGGEPNSRTLGDLICINHRASHSWGGELAQIDVLDRLARDGGVATFAEPLVGLIEEPMLKVSCRGLPVAVALGKCNLWRYAFSDRGTGIIGYKFLNMGFKMAATAGTDLYINEPARPISPGHYRVYAKLKDLSWEQIIQSYKEQKLFVTTGPFVILKIDGQDMGSTINLPEKGGNLAVEVEAGHLYGIKRIEILKNGKVVREILPEKEENMIQEKISLPVNFTCWIAARVTGKQGEFWGNWAHTAPFYIQVGNMPIKPATEDIEYFLQWLSNLKKGILGIAGQLKWKEDYYTPYFNYIEEAEQVYKGLRDNPRKW